MLFFSKIKAHSVLICVTQWFQGGFVYNFCKEMKVKYLVLTFTKAVLSVWRVHIIRIFCFRDESLLCSSTS